LKAVESLTVDTPILSKFMKLIVFELSLGVNMTCAGVLDRFEFLLFWWYFQSVFDLTEFELVLKYFKDLPTTDEYDGFTL